tara:strand:+ start:463 stop:765 length:303 start_codon:yes stop_codon:yes gene_type:complete
MAIPKDYLPPYAYIMYRYVLHGGVLDGTKKDFPHDVEDITVPAFTGGLSQQDANLNVSHHGHPYPVDTKFYLYQWHGKISDGSRVMDFVGHRDNPLQIPL